MDFIAERGLFAFQAAVSGGQYVMGSRIADRAEIASQLPATQADLRHFQPLRREGVVLLVSFHQPRVLVGDGRDVEVGAGFRERNGVGLAKATVAAGDDRPLAGERECEPRSWV